MLNNQLKLHDLSTFKNYNNKYWIYILHPLQWSATFSLQSLCYMSLPTEFHYSLFIPSLNSSAVKLWWKEHSNKSWQVPYPPPPPYIPLLPSPPPPKDKHWLLERSIRQTDRKINTSSAKLTFSNLTWLHYLPSCYGIMKFCHFIAHNISLHFPFPTKYVCWKGGIFLPAL